MGCLPFNPNILIQIRGKWFGKSVEKFLENPKCVGLYWGKMVEANGRVFH